MKKIIDQHYKKTISCIAPPSKSITIRAIALAMLTLKYNREINEFTIHNFSYCDDAQVAIEIAKKLGYIIDFSISNTITLKYVQNNFCSDDFFTFNCEESALCYRLFSYLIQLFHSNIRLETSGTLTNRIKNYPNILTEKLHSGKYEIDCSQTSQSLTGLMFALPFIENDSLIEVHNLVSKGYIDINIELLRHFGVNIVLENISEKKENIKIKGNQKINKNILWIEGDWSAAANFFVLGAISGETIISNVNLDSKQPDAIILKLFKSLKIKVSQLAKNIFAIHKSEYTGFEFDATNYPDLVPPLVVLAFNAKTPSKIIGIHRLINKESNRRDVLLKVFSLLGGKIRIIENHFEIFPSKLTGGFADSHNDHRIAMAIAISAKICNNPIILTGAECVNKSFPDFWKYFD